MAYSYAILNPGVASKFSKVSPSLQMLLSRTESPFSFRGSSIRDESRITLHFDFQYDNQNQLRYEHEGGRPPSAEKVFNLPLTTLYFEFAYCHISYLVSGCT
jgi:hypothetical protein